MGMNVHIHCVGEIEMNASRKAISIHRSTNVQRNSSFRLFNVLLLNYRCFTEVNEFSDISQFELQRPSQLVFDDSRLPEKFVPDLSPHAHIPLIILFIIIIVSLHLCSISFVHVVLSI